MIEDIWRDSSYPEAVADYFEEKGMEKGMAKGMEQGMEKGMEQGIAKGEKVGQLAAMRTLAHDAISTRFPDLSAEILARIAALTDSVTLRRLILQPSEIPDVAALVAILEAAEAVPPTE